MPTGHAELSVALSTTQEEIQTLSQESSCTR